MPAAPVFLRGAPIAAMVLPSRTPAAHGEPDMALMEAISDQVAVHVTNAEIHADLQREVRIRSGLPEIARAITGSLDPVAVMNACAETARPLIPFERLVVTGYDPNRRALNCAFVCGTTVPGLEQGQEFPIDDSTPKSVWKAVPVLSCTRIPRPMAPGSRGE